jgi:hypothetical protein
LARARGAVWNMIMWQVVRQQLKGWWLMRVTKLFGFLEDLLVVGICCGFIGRGCGCRNECMWDEQQKKVAPRCECA